MTFFVSKQVQNKLNDMHLIVLYDIHVPPNLNMTVFVTSEVSKVRKLLWKFNQDQVYGKK